MQSDRICACLLLLLAAALVPKQVEAQPPTDPEKFGVISEVKSSIRQALADPTSYIPAIAEYAGKKLDWDSSQVFFRHGYGEMNVEFTTTGRPGGPPIGRGAGDRKIARYALETVSISIVHNTASGILEKCLFNKAQTPNRRRLIRALFIAERAIVASLVSIKTSKANYLQWQINNRRAGSLGLLK